MFIQELQTTNPDVRLIKPDAQRDAGLSVDWLAGQPGRSTLTLMGVAAHDNKPSTLTKERNRIKGFIDQTEKLNWMISASHRVVGAIWVDLLPTQYIAAPAISIMIGDPSARGQGLGTLATRAVCDFLATQGHQTIYARHVDHNRPSRHMLHGLGFSDDGLAYTDRDGLTWQNTVLHRQS